MTAAAVQSCGRTGCQAAVRDSGPLHGRTVIYVDRISQTLQRVEMNRSRKRRATRVVQCLGARSRLPVAGVAAPLAAVVAYHYAT